MLHPDMCYEGKKEMFEAWLVLSRVLSEGVEKVSFKYIPKGGREMRASLGLSLGWGGETIPASLFIENVPGVQECQMQYLGLILKCKTPME